MLLLRSLYLYICISCFFFHQRWSTLTTPIFKHQSPGAQQMDSQEERARVWSLWARVKRVSSIMKLL